MRAGMGGAGLETGDLQHAEQDLLAARSGDSRVNDWSTQLVSGVARCCS